MLRRSWGRLGILLRALALEDARGRRALLREALRLRLQRAAQLEELLLVLERLDAEAVVVLDPDLHKLLRRDPRFEKVGYVLLEPAALQPEFDLAHFWNVE